jgi:NitT/TauT family transport system substrate-binding protein
MLLVPLLVAVACTTAPAAAPKPAPAAAPTASQAPAQANAPLPVDNAPFTVGFIQGMLDVPVGVIQKQNLASKYAVNVEFKQLGDPDAINDAFFLKQITFQPGADTAKSAIRKIQSGYGLAIYPTFKATNKLVVRSDSPIQSLADLRGQRIAVMSNTGSEFMILKWILRTDHGIDLLRDVDARSVPPPVALQLMEQREVVGALLFEPWASRSMMGGRTRVVMDIQQEWQKRKGQPLWFSAIHVDDTFAREHPNAVKRYLQAYTEAVDYINKNPEDVFSRYREAFQITNDADFQMILRNHDGIFTTRWDDAVINSIKEYLKLAVEEGTIQRVPDELFSKDFIPPPIQ